MQLKKQLLEIDDEKLNLQSKLDALTQGCRPGNIQERLTSLATTKIQASDRISAPPPPIKKKKKKEKTLNVQELFTNVRSGLFVAMA